MKTLYHLRAYLRRYARGYLLGILVILIGNVIGLYGPVLIQQAIDSLGQRHPAVALWQYAALIAVVAVAGAAFRYAERQFIAGSSRRIEYELRNDLFRHFQKLDLAFFQSNKVGDLVARATNDLSTIRMMLGPGIDNLSNTSIAFVITMVAMALIDVHLTLLAGVFLPLMTAIFVALGHRIERSYKRVQDQFGDLSAAAQENFSGIRAVKAYVQEGHEIATFARTNETYLRNSMHYARLIAGLWPAMALVGGLPTVVLLWLGGNEVIAGTLSLGKYVQFNAYLLQLMWPMIGLGWSFNLFQQGGASLERIREVMERRPAIADAPAAVTRAKSGEVEFRHVSLAYGEREVLHDVTLRIPAAATVAIVGPTGAGKSSLLNLIPRVFDTTDGAVLIDGIDVRDWSLDSLRRQIGYVPQETFLFSTSLAENVAYGLDDVSEARVAWAAGVAHLSGDVSTFPHGFGTTIGERGVTLSGGQKQRTAIARAVAKDPRILLLDDALSSVDTHTEDKILHQLRGVMEGRTAIIVSHRVSTVRDADSIVVLDDGRIVEQGTHDELVRLGGIYAAMYRRQLLSEELDVMDEEVT